MTPHITKLVSDLQNAQTMQTDSMSLQSHVVLASVIRVLVARLDTATGYAIDQFGLEQVLKDLNP